MKLECGIQLYTLRKEMKNLPTFEKTLEFVASTGAKTVELSGIPQIAPTDIARALKDNGLYACSTHFKFDRIRNDIDRFADEHLTYGCKSIGMGTMPQEYSRTSKDSILKFCDVLNTAAEKIADRGMTINYHNHSEEFRKVEGDENRLDIIYNNTVNNVTFCFDVYWAIFGKQDAKAVIDRLGERTEFLHMKGMKKGFFGKFKMCSPAEGIIDYKDIITYSEKYGTKFALIEVDTTRNPHATCISGMEYLKKEYLNK